MKRSNSYLKRKLNDLDFEKASVLGIDESDWLINILCTSRARSFENSNNSYILMLQTPLEWAGFQEEEYEM